MGIWDGNAVLRLADGRRVTVKLEALRSESRIQAQQLAASLASSRSGRVKELQGIAIAAAAPAPNPLPQPPPAPAYTAPQKDANAGEFLSQLDSAIIGGHLVALFDALPPSYRNDVNAIVKLGAQKISPATWQALVGSPYRLGDLIVTHQRWFLSSPRIQALPPDQLEEIEGPVMTVAGLLRDGLDPEATQLDKLQTMDFGDWLAQRDQAIAPHLAQLFRLGGESLGRQITVDSEGNGLATVTITGNSGGSKVTYALVEGYWVPKKLADQWAQSVEALKKEISETPEGGYLNDIGLIVGALTPNLEPLTQATDAGGFHAAMEPMLAAVEPVAGSIAAMLGRSINLASRGGATGGYGDEYGDMDMDMGDMEMEDPASTENMDMEMETAP